MNYEFMTSNVHAGVWQNHYWPTDSIKNSSKLQVRSASLKTQSTQIEYDRNNLWLFPVCSDWIYCLILHYIFYVHKSTLCHSLTTESYPFFCFAEYDDQKYRVRAIHALVHKLPEKNRAMLDLLTNHLFKYVHINTCCAFIVQRLENDLSS